MNLSHWLRPRTARRAPQRPAFRPRVEALEDRATPSAGALDPRFDTDGKLVSDFTAVSFGASTDAPAVAEQPSDHSLVAVSAFPGGVDYVMRLTRYHADGSIDTTFGTGGSVTDVNCDRPAAVAVLPDGKILVAGANNSVTQANYFIYLARFLPNGDLDPTFGTGGRTLSDIGNGGASAMQLLADGSILVGGNGGSGFNIVRYSPDGELDISFGSGGEAYIANGGYVSDFAVQANGDIVAIGPVRAPSGNQSLEVVQFTSAGQLDTSFNHGQGWLLQDFGTGYTPTSVTLQPSSTPGSLAKIVVGGSQSGLGKVIRFTADGDVDPTFASSGIFTSTDRTQLDRINDTQAQPDGKLLLVGVAQGNGDPSNAGFGAIRLSVDGQLDATFGKNGAVFTDLGGVDVPTRGLLQSDGNLVLVGTSNDGATHLAMARYLTEIQVATTTSVTGGNFIFDNQPHPATGSVTAANGDDLGSPTFIYHYQDGDGNWVLTGNDGADPPVEPGNYKAVGSFAATGNYLASSATAYITIAYEVRTLTDLSRAFKSGRTIPIKLQLVDANGNNMSSSDIAVMALRLERVNADGSRTPVELHDSGNSNPDNLFRYDAALGGYIFNLSTKGLGAGTYKFYWMAEGDPTEHELGFRLE